LLGDGGGGEPPPTTSVEGWRLFLRMERCAALLERSLAADPVAVDAVGLTALRAGAGEELRRILSARGQLRVVADAARELGIEVLVLKGTADVARGAPVLVMDVDVLARPDEARRLAT